MYSERVSGADPNASPIATADGLISLATAGKSYVIRAGEKLEVVGVFGLELDDGVDTVRKPGFTVDARSERSGHI